MLERLLDTEPHVTGQVVAAALGLVVTLGLDIPAPVQAALVTLVVATVTWWSRGYVTPEARAIRREVVAAEEAATRTALELGKDTVGAVGDITEDALEVVGDVVDEVTGTVEDEGDKQ
jgi:hypothetical protein